MLPRLKRRAKSALRALVRHSASATPSLPPARWGLRADDGGGLTLDGLRLHDLLARFGSPLHVVHASALARNVAAFHSPSPGGRRCEVYYSYKTNPVPGVLAFLHERGVGAEVISPYELWLAFQLGVPADRIVYNGPAKSDQSLREAIERGLLLINVNHREEIARVARIAAGVGRRARIGIRVVPPGGWSGQFGVPIAGGEAMRAYREALSLESLDVVGLHAHRGAELRTREALEGFVDAVLDFSDELAGQLGLRVGILDFGGSLAVPTVATLSPVERRLNRTLLRPLPPPRPEQSLSIEDYARALLARVEGHFNARGVPVPRIFVEPGRALTGNSQLLLTTVLTTKRGGDELDFAVLDAGINIAECVQSEYHQLFPVNRFGAPEARTYALTGPICTPADVLYPAARLPELRPGDSLAIMDAGAYFVPFATSFSFPRPAIVMADDGDVTLLREAETFADVMARQPAAHAVSDGR